MASEIRKVEQKTGEVIWCYWHNNLRLSVGNRLLKLHSQRPRDQWPPRNHRHGGKMCIAKLTGKNLLVITLVPSWLLWSPVLCISCKRWNTNWKKRLCAFKEKSAFFLNALAAVLRFVCQSSKFNTAQLLVSKKLRLEKYRLSNCDLFSTLSIQPMVKPIELNYYNIMSNIL